LNLFYVLLRQKRNSFSHREFIGDKHRVCEVLANYLSNVAKFTPHEVNIRLGVICNGTNTTDPPFLEQLEPDQLNGVYRYKFFSWDWKQKESKKQSIFVGVILYVEGGRIGLRLCFSKRTVELSEGIVGL
jgi:hypothetical protein